MSLESRRRDGEIRALRAPKPEVDPWHVLDALIERERDETGRIRSVAALFLAGRECPFTCVFCDLWRSTLNEATPEGALPRQIEQGLGSLGASAAECDVVKLYNASNFFDPLAVPDADLTAIVRSVAGFSRLTVESHPRLVGRRALALAERLSGELEIAMGLESVHPEVLPRLNKAMTIDDFDRAADTLLENGIGVRAFVLVGVPFLDDAAQVEWAVRAAGHALDVGARHVSIIPVRGGNGEMERLAARGEWRAPSLEQLEGALEALLGQPGRVVTADTWDLGQLATCSGCFRRRVERLEAMNLSGEVAAREPCDSCGWN